MVTCNECGAEHPKKDIKLWGWTCSRCVQMLVDGTRVPSENSENSENSEKPEKKEPKPRKTYVSKTGFPRGWHFKAEYIAPDGTKYHRGKRVED